MVLHSYDVCLFDLDGTLVDVEWSYVRRVFDRVGDRLEYAFADHEAEALWHGLGGSRNALLRQWDVPVEPFWTAFDDVADPRSRAAETFLYDDAAFVGDLDCPVGLVTHCPAPVTAEVLADLGIRDWFDAVVCCGEDTGWKPDPAPVQRALADLGVDARRDLSRGGRGVLAGDSANDVGAAWNAGLDGVHVERHEPGSRGYCVLGDYRVSSFADLQVAADGGRATRK